MKKTILSTITFVLLSFQLAQSSNSYNLPLEISEVALNGKGGDGGTDSYEFKKLNAGNLGVSGGRSFVGDGLTQNSGGIDIKINIGWYPSEFGNEAIYLRLFYLNASPLLYSPEGLHLESRFNTRILETEAPGGVIERIKILRSNGYLMEYQLEETGNKMIPIGKQAGYQSYVLKISETEFHRCDGLGNKIIYDLNNPDNITYQSAFGRTVTTADEGAREELLYVDLDDGGQRIRQVKTAQGVADILVINPWSYTVEFYDDSDVGAKGTDGYYTFTGTPIASWKIENPSGNDDNFDRLEITKVMGTQVFEYVYDYTPDFGWKLETGENEAKRTESHTKTSGTSSDSVINNWVLRNYVGERVREYAEQNQDFSFGKAVTQRGVNTDEGFLWQKMDYFDDASQLASYGKLQSIESPNGSWVTFDYDSSGRMHMKHNTYDNSSKDDLDNSAQTEYLYEPVTDYDNFDFAANLPRQIIGRVAGRVVSKSFMVYHFADDYSEYEQIVEQAHNANASYGDPLNPRVITRYYGSIASIDKVARGRQKSVQYANDRYDQFFYEKLGNGNIKTTIQEGTMLNPEGIA
ncbi:MAG: hypothetical protein MI748_08475 [Opitutales bacterium]|nr:hypothetical protein [Opitutales bacterium]